MLMSDGVFLPSVFAQVDELLGNSDESGLTNVTDETTKFSTDEDDTTPGEVINSPYSGPIDRVDERLPHDACDNCFTGPGLSGPLLLQPVAIPCTGSTESYNHPQEVCRAENLGNGSLTLCCAFVLRWFEAQCPEVMREAHSL